MHIDRIVGNSLFDALERARAAHGDQAVVLSQEVLASGNVALAVVRKDSGASARPAQAARPDPLREVVAKLERHGASAAFVERVRAAVAPRLGSGHAVDLAAEAIAALHPAVALPKVAGATQLVAFVGPTGAGKTSLVAKLALRLAAARRKIALVSLDAARPGAVEPLVAVAKRCGLPLVAPRDEAALEIADLYGADLVLVDTCGDARRDLEQLAPFAGAGLEKLRLSTQLVLPATSSVDAHAASLERWSALAPAACALTKLDETRRPVPTLEFALERALPVSFYSDGPDLDRHFHRAAPDHAADLCLAGVLA